MRKLPVVIGVLLAFVFPSLAQADSRWDQVWEDIIRGNYAVLERDGKRFNVIRKKLRDETVYVELREVGSNTLGDRWSYSVLLDGREKGLVRQLVAEHGTEVMSYYELNEQNRVARQISVMKPGLMTVTTTILRDKTGSVYSGALETAWFNPSQPTPFHEMTQLILFTQASKDRTILTFEDHDQPGAFPLAGYEFVRRRDGKNILRECVTFKNNTCRTTP